MNNLFSEKYTIGEIIEEWKKKYPKTDITYNSIFKLAKDNKLSLSAYKVSWPYKIWTVRANYINELIGFRDDEGLSLVEEGFISINNIEFSFLNDTRINENNIKLTDISDYNNIKITINNNYFKDSQGNFKIENKKQFIAPYTEIDIEDLNSSGMVLRDYLANYFNTTSQNKQKKLTALSREKMRPLTLKDIIPQLSRQFFSKSYSQN